MQLVESRQDNPKQGNPKQGNPKQGNPKMKARILNFHGVGTPGARIEAAERPYWITGDAFHTVIDHLAIWGQQHPIAITFDDGNLSDLEIAAPALAAKGLSAHFFVLTGRLETPGYLSANDLRRLRDMGFIIGTHGQDHLSWPDQSSEVLHREIHTSRDRLQDILGTEITQAAVPFGNYNRNVLAALKAAGFTAVWTSDGGTTNLDAFLRPRTSIRNDMTIDRIRSLLTAPPNPVREIRRAISKSRKRLF